MRMRLSSLERRTLYDVFASYRACKVLLDRELVRHPSKPPAKPGYEKAVDPDLIRAHRVHPPLPSAAGSIASPMLSVNEEQWQSFVDWVDRRVRRLPRYQRCIVRMRFLGREPLPTDKEVHDKLEQSGWCFSKRYFDEQKAQSLATLSRLLNVSGGADSEE